MLKRGPSLAGRAAARRADPQDVYGTDDQEDALAAHRPARCSQATGAIPAVESILRREPFDRDVQDDDLDELKAACSRSTSRHLVIQGPPGSGKTWTIGRLIARARRGQARPSASPRMSHKAIHNAARRDRRAASSGSSRMKKASGGNPESFYEGDARRERHGQRRRASTATSPRAPHGSSPIPTHDRKLDYLFIDEAGQVSLADALAMATCARNVDARRRSAAARRR